MAHLFVIETAYTAPLSRIDALMDDQRAWLDEGYARGTLLASGRQVPRKGMMILAAGQSKAEVERYLSGAPLSQAEAVEYRITEFVPVKTCDALEHLRSDK